MNTKKYLIINVIKIIYYKIVSYSNLLNEFYSFIRFEFLKQKK